jgi:hypothetical protein
MRILIVTAAALSFCTGAAFAEMPVAPRPAADPRASVVQPTKQSAYETAVADCERMWDRGTHMTKRDWSQTCRRVQHRLEHLELR